MNSTRFLLVACAFGALLSPTAFAAGDGVRLELRAYPSGQIAGVGWESGLPLLGAQYRGSAAVFYNRARRGDSGVHQEERGSGYGGGLAVERYFSSNQLGWYAGVRADVFSVRIDYRDGNIAGSSRVTVVQPTINAGYAFDLGNQQRLQLSLGVGAEINARTRGEKVGDGAIGLAGVSLSWW
jgi:hypothetical protein